MVQHFQSAFFKEYIYFEWLPFTILRSSIISLMLFIFSNSRPQHKIDSRQGLDQPTSQSEPWYFEGNHFSFDKVCTTYSRASLKAITHWHYCLAWVFPRLAPVSLFPALGTRSIFSRVLHHLPIITHGICSIFPALIALAESSWVLLLHSLYSFCLRDNNNLPRGMLK